MDRRLSFRAVPLVLASHALNARSVTAGDHVGLFGGDRRDPGNWIGGIEPDPMMLN